MLPRNHPDRIQITFDDHRLVANAGLILPATLGLHLGLPPLVDRHLDLDHAPGRANPGDKMMTLLASALAGGDCIDAADALRTGGTARVLGCVVKAHRLLYAHTHLGYRIWQMVFHRYPFRRTRCFAHVMVKPSRLAKRSSI